MQVKRFPSDYKSQVSFGESDLPFERPMNKFDSRIKTLSELDIEPDVFWKELRKIENERQFELDAKKQASRKNGFFKRLNPLRLLRSK